MSDSRYSPNRWAVIEFEGIYKVLGGWYGGFAQSDHWRLNSGITSIQEFDKYYEVHGNSGSVYVCYKKCEGFSSLTAEIFSYFEKHGARAVPMSEVNLNGSK